MFCYSLQGSFLLNVNINIKRRDTRGVTSRLERSYTIICFRNIDDIIMFPSCYSLLKSIDIKLARCVLQHSMRMFDLPLFRICLAKELGKMRVKTAGSVHILSGGGSRCLTRL